LVSIVDLSERRLGEGTIRWPPKKKDTSAPMKPEIEKRPREWIVQL
jgi:hypothetical protein